MMMVVGDVTDVQTCPCLEFLAYHKCPVLTRTGAFHGDE